MARLTAEIEEFLSGLGFELVTLDRGGGRRVSHMRLKIDRPWGEPGRSEVTVDDCTRVARELRGWMSDREDVPEALQLEVSSPGVERPLVRPRDYSRFAGETVRLKGYGPLVEGRKELEGRLLGLAGPEDEQVALEIGGERVEVSLSAVASGHLVYDWESEL